jgi:methyl-accepting chemotaxis protein
LQQIVADSTEVTALIDAIADASRRQQDGAAQVERSIAQLAELIARITSAAADGSRRSENLATASESLHRNIGDFRVG